jgi:hypothetical protein
VNLYLIRKPYPEGTPGILLVNDKWFCWTLEDKVRQDPKDKVPGDTAIPAGRYSIVLDWSNKFQKVMPFVRDVQGFTAIEFHSGNNVDDTDGCILLAYERDISSLKIWNPQGMRKAIDDLIAALKKDEINWLEIFTAWPYRAMFKP